MERPKSRSAVSTRLRIVLVRAALCRASGRVGPSFVRSRQWFVLVVGLLLPYCDDRIFPTIWAVAASNTGAVAEAAATTAKNGSSNNGTSIDNSTSNPYLCNVTTHYIETLQRSENDPPVSLRLSTDGATLVFRGPPIRVYDFISNASVVNNSNSGLDGSDNDDEISNAPATTDWLERRLPPYQQEDDTNISFTSIFTDDDVDLIDYKVTPSAALLGTVAGDGGNRLFAVVLDDRVTANGTTSTGTIGSSAAATETTLPTNATPLLYEMDYWKQTDTWTANKVETGSTNNSSDKPTVDMASRDNVVALETNALGNVIVVHDASGTVQVWQRPNEAAAKTAAAGLWMPMGQSLITSPSNSTSPRGSEHLSLSANGTILAIGDSTVASVTVYQFESGSGGGNIRGTWTQLGQRITGGPYFGHAVSLSATGTTVAIGAATAARVGNLQRGQVQVHEFVVVTNRSTANGSGSNATTKRGYWSRLGNSMDGGTVGENFGYTVAISSLANGLVLVVGASGNRDGRSNGPALDNPSATLATGSGGMYLYMWNDNDPMPYWQTVTSHSLPQDNIESFHTNSVTMSANGRTVAYDFASALVVIVHFDVCYNLETSNATMAPSSYESSMAPAPPSKSSLKTELPLSTSSGTVAPSFVSTSTMTLSPTIEQDDDVVANDQVDTWETPFSAPPPPPLSEQPTRPLNAVPHDVLLAATLNLTGVNRRLDEPEDVWSFQVLLADFFDKYFTSATIDSSRSNLALVRGVTEMQTIIRVTGQEVLLLGGDFTNRITYVQATTYETLAAAEDVDPALLIQLPFLERASRESFLQLLGNSSIAGFATIEDVGLPAVPTNVDRGTQRPVKVSDNDKREYLNALLGAFIGAIVAVVMVSALFRKRTVWKRSGQKEMPPSPLVATLSNNRPTDERDLSGTADIAPIHCDLHHHRPEVASALGRAAAAAAPSMLQRRPLEPVAPISRIKFVENGRAPDESSVSRMSTEEGSLSNPSTTTLEAEAITALLLGNHRQQFVSAPSFRSTVAPQFATSVIRLEPEGANLSIVEHQYVLVAVVASPTGNGNDSGVPQHEQLPYACTTAD